MVGDDDVQTKVCGEFDLPAGADAAIHGDDDGHAGNLEGLHSLHVQAVPFCDAMGNVGSNLPAQGFQSLGEDGRGRNAIRVKVAENADNFARFDGLRQTRHGRGHLRQQVGVVEGFRRALQEEVDFLQRAVTPRL